MKFSIVAAVALASSLVSGYTITGSGVHCRSGPGTGFSVKKSYDKDVDVKVTCQTSGTSVNGNRIWDKTSDGCYVTDYYVRTFSSTYVMDRCGGSTGGSGGSGGNLAGLDATQTKYAKAIIAEAKKEGLGHQGCLAGITTALTESSLIMYASNAVPASLKYPHDRVGGDLDSIGLFQQRYTYYKDVAADMDPARSAAQFFAVMKKISGWKTMDVPTLCQKVQRSGPDVYAEQYALAKKVCASGGD